MRPRAAAILAHVLAIGVAVPGCGFCETPLQTGRRLDDGISPYVERAPVEVCVARARLADAPSVVAAGVCNASGRAPRTCATASDCGAREGCVCGRCTVQVCRFSSECAAGLQCVGTPRRCANRCSSDTDCPAGEICGDGACTEACAADDACAHGERCLAGRCAALVCGPGSGCAPDEECDSQVVDGRVRAPGVLAVGERTVLYAELLDQDDVGTILRAESSDGIHFAADPEVPVVTATAPALSVRAPSPLVDADGGVTLFFALDDGRAIASATSSDGKTFSDAETVLVPRDAWEAGRVAAPAAVRDGDAVLLFYEGGVRAGVGLAVSRGGRAFERVGAEPVLSPTQLEVPASWAPVSGVGAPWPLVVESALGARTIRLFVSGDGVVLPPSSSGDGGLPLADPSLGIAIAPAGFSGVPIFEPSPSGPVLARVRSFEQLLEDDPSIIHTPTQWRAYFTSSPRGSISLATQ